MKEDKNKNQENKNQENKEQENKEIDKSVEEKLREENIEIFEDDDGVKYTNESLFSAIYHCCDGTYGAGGDWAICVQKMGQWYVANIHDYNQGALSECSLLNGRKVRHDCSGYTTACLWLFGALLDEIWPPPSKSYTYDERIAQKLTSAGFIKLPFSFTSVKPFDIMTYDGHVEIYNGFVNNKHTSWAWGACHDMAHGGLPCGTAAIKRGYDVIWRKI